ncbi:twin-arginine translocase TatA/TatE family subunit [Acinetobacter sichuanensis]|uniref:Sec-independent protein translocase protein TatA n=1 Tax=Acinetobacter sichuanensis TaxID=2136183 RepID=A0A371YM54_9GAMM|nr:MULTISPECIES: twin-arginine translocase TatA/TatE family subunit [Acinetobacter]MDM1248777.1 twin-arginine translocase TatA/TatE family subunit [Acinetobacter sp. R933-2]MDM1767984.1 twin-arginine translocase TatA/TatE family subunit [Acinetobacter sp. 226-4]MDQ9022096.1 twin-arginine translocase TatA/TatE family subunit [Acinetobacter sichuanensis]RFC82546.1 twin-arginine translocase TatA/TatE family subunit [Acinetobacter sichuanensis]
MLGLSIGHIVLFLLVLVLLFGTSKLKNLGKDLGGALKDFRKSINDDDLESSSTKPKDKN